MKFGGEKTLFEIGNETVIREFCTLNRGTLAHGKSSIGSQCLLMAYAHVAHDCTVGDHVIMANGVQLGGHVTIEDWAILGGMTPVHQFCKVGQHAMIGGGFRVIQDVPPYILASEEPLRFCGLNSIGLKRRGFSEETVMTLKRAYRFAVPVRFERNSGRGANSRTGRADSGSAKRAPFYCSVRSRYPARPGALIFVRRYRALAFPG